MTALRLLADDLTGALDSAARFVPVHGPIPVCWRRSTETAAAAYTSETREAADPGAGLARWLPAIAGAALVFKKVDSRLRGHVAAEVAACLRTGAFLHAVIAPAFPFQGRITRDGRQYANGRDVGVDLELELARQGIMVSKCRPGEAASPGVSLWDAIDEGDLDLIAAAGRQLSGGVLWVGTGGLAAALAGRGAPPSPPLARPVLALVGSDHPASQAQFAACDDTLELIDEVGARAVAPMVGRRSMAIRVLLPEGTERGVAAARIGSVFNALARSIRRPGCVAVTGGETLRRLLEGVEASHLMVLGEREPGAPVASIEGGVWDGVMVLAKSGGFGRPDFLAKALEG